MKQMSQFHAIQQRENTQTKPAHFRLLWPATQMLPLLGEFFFALMSEVFQNFVYV